MAETKEYEIVRAFNTEKGLRYKARPDRKTVRASALTKREAERLLESGAIREAKRTRPVSRAAKTAARKSAAKVETPAPGKTDERAD